jgi:hypothetical protein
MVLYKVYSQEYRIRYFAHPCSTAVLFQIACLLFTFLPPLFTGYFTSGFYYKELSYSEQPNVTFLQRYNLIISSPSTLIFSSSETILNNYFLSSYSPTILGSSIPRDVNGDGIVDQHTITINITASSTISTQVIDLWLIFQYALNQYPLVNMETLGLISLNAPSSISNYQAVTIYGQLVFQQRAPVLSYENVSALQGPIIDYGNYSVVPSFDDILNNYRARNYSTTFNVQYVQWSPSTSTTNTQLTIKVVVNTGSQVIRYVPSFWKVFRWAWIQYIAGLLPFFYVMNKIKEFVFSNGLVRTVIKKSP